MNLENKQIKEQFETVKKNWKIYNDVLININKNLQPVEILMEKQYSDTIKNIAIISGALASFSLTIFSSVIKKIDDLLIIGVSLLLINVVVTFSHLISRTTRGFQNLRHEKDKSGPLQEVVDYSQKFYFGEVTFEEWQKIDKGLDERLREKINSPPPNKIKITHVDGVAIIILEIAIILVILSFVIPALQSLKI